MLSILITNDDGIDAHGLHRLARAALRYGEVWAVAPDGQRSAASHSITLRSHIDVYPYKEFPAEGVRAFSCSGTPADCVRVGGLAVMPKKPDVVLSGINLGYNTATDIQYSATAGAAFEAAFQGFHAIALSEAYAEDHTVTDKYLDEVLSELIGKRLGYGQIYNVNFPSCPIDECKGILRERKVSHGAFFRDGYAAVEELADGGVRYKVDGKYDPYTEEGTDLRAVLDNYISIGIATNIT